ncbi:hypothetical protein BD769DRAFT_1774577 [Suillus cothurnatus]|nr:hypothetical protein BD769DRAFT_1774577 [Suillus cothurnatus]
MTSSHIESNLTGALEAYNVLTPEDIEIPDGVAADGKQKRFMIPYWGEYLSTGIDLGFDDWPVQINQEND